MTSCTPVGMETYYYNSNVTIVRNVTLQVNVTATGIEEHFDTHRTVERVLYNCVLPAMCCFGILGNILNLLVLSRKSLTMRMERLEQCAHIHLIALAVSDLMYCITALPLSSKPNFVQASHISGWIVYEAYHGAVINTFLLCSSWLTVAMAVSRYIAICYPVRARQHLGITATRIVIALIFITSVLFNLPRYFIKSIHSRECQEGGYSYFVYMGPLRKLPVAEHIYLWIYFVIGIIIPLIAVAYCNIYFIKALQASKKLRRQHSRTRASLCSSSFDVASSSTSSTPPSNTSIVLTLTLSIIVLLYIVLVIPAEIIQFFKPLVTRRYYRNHRLIAHYALASAVCNLLQVFNFAVNFLLYCLINVHFRSVITSVLCHLRQSPPRHVRKVTWGERHSMLTTTTTSNGNSMKRNHSLSICA